MQRSSRKALIAGLALSLLTTLPVAAQRRGAGDANKAPSANQIVDMADARTAALKADLRLTPDEEKNWDGFRSAIHDIAAKRADQLNNLRNGRTAANGEAPASPVAANPEQDHPSANDNAQNGAATPNQPVDTTNGNAAAQNGPPDGIQMLRDQADALNRRSNELKKIADAAQPLYASLDDTQRSRLMNFIRSNGAQDNATPPRRRRR